MRVVVVGLMVRNGNNGPRGSEKVVVVREIKR